MVPHGYERRATVPSVDDRDLVAALRSGDVRGLAGVYDAYADRLFSYAVTMLRDRDAASDAVHDALLLARDRIGQLRDPDKLRPWLYAIVRSECLRRHRDAHRLAPLAAAGDVIDVGADELDAGARAEELRELVWSAADAMNQGEREVLELTVRHGLDGAELADALNVSLNAAHALASRARAQLERSLGALLVARTGGEACGELVVLLGDWKGRLDPLLRKRVARHADRCAVCGETRRHRLNPVALLAGAPLLVAPPALRDRVLRDVAFQAPERRWRRDGFPAPVTEPRRRAGWYAAAVAVLAGLLTLGLLVRPGAEPEPLSGESLAQGLDGEVAAPTTTAPGTPAPSATTPMPTSTGTAPTASPTPEPTSTTAAPTTPAPTAAPTRPPTPGPTTPRPTTPPTTPPPPPVRPSISISWEVLTPDCTLTYRARLTAVVTGTTPDSVVATISRARVRPDTQVMSSAGGGTWTALVSLTGGVDHTWTATATTGTDVLTSAPAPARHDCIVIG